MLQNEQNGQDNNWETWHTEISFCFETEIIVVKYNTWNQNNRNING